MNAARTAVVLSVAGLVLLAGCSSSDDSTSTPAGGAGPSGAAGTASPSGGDPSGATTGAVTDGSLAFTPTSVDLGRVTAPSSSFVQFPFADAGARGVRIVAVSDAGSAAGCRFEGIDYPHGTLRPGAGGAVSATLRITAPGDFTCTLAVRTAGSSAEIPLTVQVEAD